jgi:hypothetical protein
MTARRRSVFHCIRTHSLVTTAVVGNADRRVMSVDQQVAATLVLKQLVATTAALWNSIEMET